MTILVTGGLGYIGAHTCIELLQANHKVVIVDNLSNSKAGVVDAIREVCGTAPILHVGDIRNSDFLDKVFDAHKNISSVMHFAGLKSVSESITNPLSYYDVNVTGSIQLIKSMTRAGVHSIVFSSSATVYGEPLELPVSEDEPLKPINPYGNTKQMIEQVLRDLTISGQIWSIASLRYFNPVGAHPSAKIGESSLTTPTNLMPIIVKTAKGELDELVVYGDDYPTPDGSCIRDYIHVVDLARAHVRALDVLNSGAERLLELNLGTGRGHSVFEVIREFEAVNGVSVPYRVGERRTGDAPVCYANPGKATEVLGWSTQYGLKQMCSDSWRWACSKQDR